MPRDFRMIFQQKKDDSSSHRARRRYKLNGHRRLNFRHYIILIFFIILISIIVYFLFFTDYFLIKQIKVIYTQNKAGKLIKEEEIKNLVFTYYQKNNFLNLKKNILFFNSKTVEKQALSDSRLTGIQITKRWPDFLLIKISEAQPIARLIIFGSDSQLLTAEARLIPDKNFDPSLFNNLPVIYDKTTGSFNSYDLNLAILNAINLANIAITTNDQILFPLIFIQEEAGVIKIVTQSNEKWQAFFMPSQDFNRQINNLILVLQEKLQDRSKLEYIDLRFGNRVFYKESPF